MQGSGLEVERMPGMGAGRPSSLAWNTAMGGGGRGVQLPWRLNPAGAPLPLAGPHAVPCSSPIRPKYGDPRPTGTSLQHPPHTHTPPAPPWPPPLRHPGMRRRSLHDVCAVHPQGLPLPDARRVLYQLTQAVAFLHERQVGAVFNIIHYLHKI
jgi:hypothetical protein